MKTDQIKNPSYSETRAMIREHILVNVVEFVEEIKVLEKELIKSFVTIDRDNNTQITTLEIADESQYIEFSKRWQVCVTTDDDLKFQFQDLKNARVLHGKIELFNDAKNILPDVEYILIPKTFSAIEARAVLQKKLEKPTGYEDFKDFETLDHAISFFKTVRYNEERLDDAIRIFHPKYNNTAHPEIREKYIRRYNDILSIIDFPTDLKTNI